MGYNHKQNYKQTSFEWPYNSNKIQIQLRPVGEQHSDKHPHETRNKTHMEFFSALNGNTNIYTNPCIHIYIYIYIHVCMDHATYAYIYIFIHTIGYCIYIYSLLIAYTPMAPKVINRHLMYQVMRWRIYIYIYIYNCYLIYDIMYTCTYMIFIIDTHDIILVCMYTYMICYWHRIWFGNEKTGGTWRLQLGDLSALWATPWRRALGVGDLVIRSARADLMGWLCLAVSDSNTKSNPLNLLT